MSVDGEAHILEEEEAVAERRADGRTALRPRLGSLCTNELGVHDVRYQALRGRQAEALEAVSNM